MFYGIEIIPTNNVKPTYSRTILIMANKIEIRKLQRHIDFLQ